MRRLLALAGLLLALALPVGSAWAVNPDEMLADPALEARAREISKGLRCLVCQNESIDESNADLARDLRLLVRDRLKKGDSDQQVVAYIVSRYGNYVLLKPPFEPGTWGLWLGPPVLLLAGGFAVWRYYKGRGTAAPAVVGLSDEERQRLDSMLRGGDQA